MVYAFLQDVPVNDDIHRIIGRQIDMVMSGLDHWEESIKKIIYVSAHIEKILVVYDLVSEHAVTEFADKMDELKKIQKNFSAVYQSTIHLRTFNHLKKVHPDWFNIHPSKMTENILNEECKIALLDNEYINEIVHEAKTVLYDVRNMLDKQGFGTVDLQDIITGLHCERQNLSEMNFLVRNEPTDENIRDLNTAITKFRLKTVLFRKLDHKFTKFQKRTLKPLTRHIRTHTRLTSLRENLLEHPEHYGSYSEILRLLGLIDRTKKEMISQINPLLKMTFTNLNMKKKPKLALTLNN